MSQSKEWANPAPAGLVALAVACFIFYALLSGTVKPGALPLLGCWLIGGFVVQLVVGILELKEGALTGGNVFLFFSAFFMLVGGMEMFIKFFAGIYGWPIDATIDGWAWLVLLIILTFYTFAYFKQSALVMSILLVLLDIGVFFVTFIDIGWMSPAYKPFAAYFLLATGVCGIYMSSAIILNAAFGKTVLPVGKPILK
ncbi:MAG: hypothetical protein HPY50_22450 [Firmicutes bacterium]|nr:hypothetical protein [Bacillota bacterium]